MKFRKLGKAIGGGALISIGVILLNMASQQAQQGNALVGGVLGIVGGVFIIAGLLTGGE